MNTDCLDPVGSCHAPHVGSDAELGRPAATSARRRQSANVTVLRSSTMLGFGGEATRRSRSPPVPSRPPLPPAPNRVSHPSGDAATIPGLRRAHVCDTDRVGSSLPVPSRMRSICSPSSARLGGVRLPAADRRASPASSVSRPHRRRALADNCIPIMRSDLALHCHGRHCLEQRSCMCASARAAEQLAHFVGEPARDREPDEMVIVVDDTGARVMRMRQEVDVHVGDAQVGQLDDERDRHVVHDERVIVVDVIEASGQLVAHRTLDHERAIESSNPDVVARVWMSSNRRRVLRAHGSDGELGDASAHDLAPTT